MEIFLIWTNVARTNVAWTNVNLIVGICSRCSQEATFKVSSKSDQLQLFFSSVTKKTKNTQHKHTHTHTFGLLGPGLTSLALDKNIEDGGEKTSK